VLRAYRHLPGAQPAPLSEHLDECPGNAVLADSLEHLQVAVDEDAEHDVVRLVCEGLGARPRAFTCTWIGVRSAHLAPYEHAPLSVKLLRVILCYKRIQLTRGDSAVDWHYAYSRQRSTRICASLSGSLTSIM
jgi:hypothetical protein